MEPAIAGPSGIDARSKAFALDRASPLSSPFYSGNTTFGGANAAGFYKRGRNLFNNSSKVCMYFNCFLKKFDIL